LVPYVDSPTKKTSKSKKSTIKKTPTDKMSNGTTDLQKKCRKDLSSNGKLEMTYGKFGSNKRRMGQNVEWEIKTNGNKVKSKKFIMGYTVQ
jgi:hypothetical protein